MKKNELQIENVVGNTILIIEKTLEKEGCEDIGRISKVWNEDEINILKQYYSLDGGMKIVYELIPYRTKKCIKAKARRLKIKSYRKIKMIDWDKEREKLLIDIYPIEGASKRLQLLLNVSDTVIYSRAQKLHIHRETLCNPFLSLRGKDNHNFKGYEDISGTYFKNIRHNAEERGLDFDITLEQIWDLFIEQDRKCLYSGLPIFFNKSYKDENGTASLDRIDSSKGYIKGNVQWVHKDINTIKWDLSREKFIYYCNLISNKFPISLDLLNKVL